MHVIRRSVASALLAASLLGAAGFSATPAWSAETKAAVPADAALTELAKAWMVAALGRDGRFIAANSIDTPAGSFQVFGTSGKQSLGYQPFLDHLTELKPFTWAEINPEGYVVDDFAWFTGTAKAPMPTGDVALVRFSMVLRKVDGAWKAVHFHLSEPVPRAGIKKGS